MGKEIQTAQDFANELAGLYGGRLSAVVLYGSAARGEYDEGRSDLNLLVLLDHVDAELLRRGSAAAQRWVRAGHAPPMLFGRDEWRQSADAFPIEFEDIRDAHLMLHGDDPFTDVAVDREHLRLQCEHELKAKQVQLREQYMLLADRPKELAHLFVRALPTFFVLFRTALRLAGQPVTRGHDGVARGIAALVGFAQDPLDAVLAMRRAGRPDTLPADDSTAVGFLEAVARTVDYVDRLDVGADGEAGVPG
jgi:hypothetical protein